MSGASAQASGAARPRHGWALHGAGALASSVLLWGFAGGAWPLGFLALVPWLLALDRTRTTLGAAASGVLMAVGFVIAALWWFGAAFAAYVGLAPATGVGVLILIAPLLQPQWMVFALVRHLWRRRRGPAWGALAGAAAFIGCEWLWPKLLGDTLGHGLQPSVLLRQLADLAGAAGLTVLILLANESLAQALLRRDQGWRARLAPIAAAALALVLAAGYGQLRLAQLEDTHATATPSIRVGLVQANLTNYERRREAEGDYAVVRDVLDTHYAMSEFAVREQGAEALLWSETVYPTTFGSPKSADGAALDRELVDFVARLGAPLLFGTYDRDVLGEYNSAALIDPQRGALGHYRKAHPFPLTEHVPGWLDRPWLRQLLPWAGSWQAGEGARVLPLSAIDGREINVVPLICLDDVHPGIAIQGARLGAQALVGLSNDSWFSGHPQGARLHLAVASFRSIETRLPQLRVTTNGLSAVLDESGEIVAQTGMAQQAVLVGALPLAAPLPTLMVRWGNWPGLAALLLLGGLALRELWVGYRRSWAGAMRTGEGRRASGPLAVAVLLPRWRMLAATLRLAAGLGLMSVLGRMLLGEGLQVNSLGQIWQFGYAVAAPALAAWAIRRAFSADASVRGGQLRLDLPALQIEVPLAQMAQLRIWRWPLPWAGLGLTFVSGRRWQRGMLVEDPQRLLAQLAEGGAKAGWASPLDARLADFHSERARRRHRLLDHPLCKLVGFPLLLALPAFRLHQMIAFGGTFGELLTYGAAAWLAGLLIWWAAWIIGLSLIAAALRVCVEALCWLAFWAVPQAPSTLRAPSETGARLLYYLGLPAWLTWRVLSA